MSVAIANKKVIPIAYIATPAAANPKPAVATS